MQTVKEVIEKHAIWSEELQEKVVPMSKIDKALQEFEGKPFEEKLSELNQAMTKLRGMFENIGKELND
jgi:hypothetical protein